MKTLCLLLTHLLLVPADGTRPLQDTKFQFDAASYCVMTDNLRLLGPESVGNCELPLRDCKRLPRNHVFSVGDVVVVLAKAKNTSKSRVGQKEAHILGEISVVNDPLGTSIRGGGGTISNSSGIILVSFIVHESMRMSPHSVRVQFTDHNTGEVIRTKLPLLVR